MWSNLHTHLMLRHTHLYMYLRTHTHTHTHIYIFIYYKYDKWQAACCVCQRDTVPCSEGGTALKVSQAPRPTALVTYGCQHRLCVHYCQQQLTEQCCRVILTPLLTTQHQVVGDYSGEAVIERQKALVIYSIYLFNGQMDH